MSNVMSALRDNSMPAPRGKSQTENAKPQHLVPQPAIVISDSVLIETT